MMKLDLRCTLLGSWSKFTVSGDGLLSGGLSSHKPRGQNWRERLVPVEMKVWITHEEESDKRKKGIKNTTSGIDFFLLGEKWDALGT